MAEPHSAEDIQQQMRQVRRELRQDVEGIVENAQVLADWRHYVRRYPLVCLGVAAAAGYWIVPARRDYRPDPAAIADALETRTLTIRPAAQRKSLFSIVVGMAGPLLWQAAMTVGRRQLDQYLSQRMASHSSHSAAESEHPAPHFD